MLAGQFSQSSYHAGAPLYSAEVVLCVFVVFVICPDVTMRRQVSVRGSRVQRMSLVAKAGDKHDYDLVIIGCGVGGHGAALHAVEQVSSYI